MKPVLVAGSLAYDRIMDFDGKFSEHFMPDKLHSINLSFFVSPPKVQFGGCAGNIAYSLSLLEGDTRIIATAGNDFSEYATHLTELGIPTETIAITEEVPTASGYIMTDKSGNQITAFSGGAMIRAYEKPIAYADYEFALVSPTAKEDMVAIPRAAKIAGLPVLFDPGQQLPMHSGEELRTAIQGATGLFANDYELALIIEKTGWSESDIASKVRFLVVTLGSEGSRILEQGSEEKVPAVLVTNPVDPTGAGDAYRAGFIKGMLAGLQKGTCAKLASTVAAYAVECYGTQNHRFTLPDLKARYETAYNEPFPL